MVRTAKGKQRNKLGGYSSNLGKKLGSMASGDGDKWLESACLTRLNHFLILDVAHEKENHQIQLQMLDLEQLEGRSSQ